MAQKSIFWTTGGAGDSAATYTQDELLRVFRTLVANGANEGVFYGALSDLAVTGSVSPVSVASGCAIVYGLFYQNDSTKTLAVPAAITGTTGHRVVLRADFTAKTVRAVLKSSADGTSSLPALTQTPGTTYEIPLAGLTMTTGGVITITDQREFLHPATMIDSYQVGPNSVFGEAALNRLLPLKARTGGTATDWGSQDPYSNVLTWAPGKVKILTGVINVTSSPAYITFPDSGFSGTPLVFIKGAGSYVAHGQFISKTGCWISVGADVFVSYSGNFYWMAIGPG